MLELTTDQLKALKDLIPDTKIDPNIKYSIEKEIEERKKNEICTWGDLAPFARSKGITNTTKLKVVDVEDENDLFSFNIISIEYLKDLDTLIFKF
jgi:hypothetical protein